MGRVETKIILVTGAGAGFGRAIVKRLINEGAKVLGIDVSGTGNQETAAELSQKEHFVPLTADITSEQTWADALALTQKHFGAPPSVMVNCAGIVHLGQIAHAVPEDDFDRVFKVNVKPLYLSTKVVIPVWIENDIQGHVINIGSISQSRPRPGTVWYASSKGAVTVATKGLAAEYAKNNIRFNVVRPSVGETAMLPRVQGGEDTPEGRAKRLATIPLGRLCQPDDVANIVCFLASDEANYITGSAFNVDGGRCIS